MNNLSWEVGMICNAVIAAAYLLICLAVVVPLARGGQLRSNPLGAATAAIFFTCAVHHGSHSVHMLLPTFAIDDTQGLAMREAWGWQLALWDVVGMLVALYYWSLRRTYSSLMEGAQLFQDFRQREQQALELNDRVMQGLVVAKMALELDEPAKARDALDSSIDAASRIITDLLGSDHSGQELRRSEPATVGVTSRAPSGTPGGAAGGTAGGSTGDSPTLPAGDDPPAAEREDR